MSNFAAKIKKTVQMNCKQILTGKSGAYTPLRDERIDSVKYWLMVLVIAGHVFARPQFSDNHECTIVWKWIYMFHMPLFVFISGYFSHKKEKTDLIASIWKLAEPLIICQVLLLVAKFVFKGSISISNILTPPFALWYLLSLIYWRLILQVIPNRLLNNTKLFLSVVFCISIIAGFLPLNNRLLSIQRTLSFMPFFFLGYYMKGKNLFLPDKYKPLSYVFLFLTFTIPVFFLQYLGNVEHADSYNNINNMYSRIFVFGLSIPMSLAFINICPNTSWVAQQGKLSMQYYIYHAITILPFISVMCKLNFPMTFWTAIIYTAIITIILGIASYLPYFRNLTNPSSIIKGSKYKQFC
jgi:fucose 4-O-acetylase-like acetyltransferase